MYDRAFSQAPKVCNGTMGPAPEEIESNALVYVHNCNARANLSCYSGELKSKTNI